MQLALTHSPTHPTRLLMHLATRALGFIAADRWRGPFLSLSPLEANNRPTRSCSHRSACARPSRRLLSPDPSAGAHLHPPSPALLDCHTPVPTFVCPRTVQLHCRLVPFEHPPPVPRLPLHVQPCLKHRRRLPPDPAPSRRRMVSEPQLLLLTVTPLQQRSRTPWRRHSVFGLALASALRRESRSTPI